MFYSEASIILYNKISDCHRSLNINIRRTLSTWLRVHESLYLDVGLNEFHKSLFISTVKWG